MYSKAQAYWCARITPNGEKWNAFAVTFSANEKKIYCFALMQMGSKHLVDIEQNCNHNVIYEAGGISSCHHYTWSMYQNRLSIVNEKQKRNKNKKKNKLNSYQIMV